MLKITEKAYGPEHISSIYAVRDCARTSKMDKNEEALALLERVLKIEEKALGPEHTSVAFTLHAIAQVRSKMGQNEEALALLERVLKIKRRPWAEHTSVALTLYEIARLRSKMGQNEEALALFERAEDRRRLLGRSTMWHLRCTRLRKCVQDGQE